MLINLNTDIILFILPGLGPFAMGEAIDGEELDDTI
jgi:hypothetical protein